MKLFMNLSLLYDISICEILIFDRKNEYENYFKAQEDENITKKTFFYSILQNVGVLNLENT